MNNPKFELKRSINNQFYFSFKSRNGEIILTGETYTTKQSCKDGIESVKLNAPYDSSYERKNGVSHTFNLKASNGQIIGRSESYSTEAARDNGIQAVKDDAPNAPTDDLS